MRRSVPAAAVLLLMASLVAVPAAAAPPPAAPSATEAARYGASTPLAQVTLLTGDVVSVGIEPDGEFTAEVTKPADRPDGPAALYSTVREGDALYVYPSDALGAVEAGRLDRRLFDVAYLVRNGYADATTKTLPVIVRQRNGLRAPADLPASARTATLPVVDAVAMAVDKPRASQFWDAASDGPVEKIWLDGRVRADLEQSVPMIGAPQAWASGLDGAGVTVAVLDTGVDAGHPDLAGKVTASQSFVPGQAVQDGNGHGTHVASTIAGSGAASDGRRKGVAPGASLLVGKVLGDDGGGFDSQVIAGMQWAVQQGADVVSMSLGGCCTDGTDPLSQAVNTLSAQSDTLFVVAAGNNGALGSRTINSPGAAAAALTVAAVDKQDGLAPFSSRGPRLGDYGLKPDIAAPGVAITAARADGTALGPVVDDKYTTISGTSMAAPHVAGAAAILAQQHPDWAGERLKDTLMSTAKDAGHGAYEQGAGRVDVARATTQGVIGTGGVDFGRIPYAQTEPVARTVTYTNDGDEPVTLALSASVTPRTGIAPAGMLRLDPATVTVPAHGTAAVAATFHPAGGPDTWYEGAVVARADGVEVRTAVGAFRDLKKVNLTLRAIPPDGATNLFWGGYVLARIDGRDEVPAIGTTADRPEVSGQIYAGRYAVRTFVEWRDSAGEMNAALVTVPDADVRNDATVVFDVRNARRIGTALPKPAERYAHHFGFESAGAGGAVRVRTEVRMFGDITLWTLPTGPKPTVGSFYAFSQQVYVEPRLSMRARGSSLDARYPVPNPFVGDDEIARFDGRSTLPVVYAAPGADLSTLDVRGKLVLLDLSDICAPLCSGYALDRVRAAATAGAAGVAGFGASGRGFLDPDPYAQRPYWPLYPIPTVSLDAAQGRALRDAVAKRPVTVDIDATTRPDYVYALSYPWEGRIPSTLTGTVRSDDLYRIENRLHGDTTGVANLDWTAQLPGISPIRRVGSGNGLPVRAPGVVTTYLGPVRRDLGWFHGGSMSYDTPPGTRAGGWAETRIEEFTRAGSRVDELGEQPLVSNTTIYSPSTPRYFTPTCLSCRNGDMFNPVHTLDNDGTGGGFQAWDITNGWYGDKQTEMKLYRDGVEVPQQTGIVWIAPPFFLYYNPYFTLPPEKANYRLTERYETWLTTQRYARTVDTEWTFTSQRPTSGYTDTADGANCMGWYITFPKPKDVCQPTSQLFLGYDLNLRLDNTLPAGGTHRITLDAHHSPFLRPAPAIRKLELWTSSNEGGQWTKVPTKALGGGRYAATVTHPGTAGAMSLRVRAVDAAGNTVTQTVLRAYGLSGR
ncbi:S8 family serine peptidase [Phytohabitans rumicis]|uniref:Peptidase n=1 Tax=Phytohabitans rumicis TaxID=1076125 RepID=A0A6V8LLV7_9ACTN|nr:S8 family serine peptidase [Phytohabitans rumicis]GFJ95077.1 peptidase [Phytohabitans rumicis]